MSENIEKTETTVNPPDTKQAENRKCRYPGCDTIIPIDHQFEICEKCRVLSVSNAVTLLTAPFSAPMERSSSVIHTMLVNMSGQEILEFHEKIEEIYLALCTARRLHNLESKKKPFRTLEEQIVEARQYEVERATEDRLRKAVTAEDKRVAQLKRLGLSEETIKSTREKARKDNIELDF